MAEAHFVSIGKVTSVQKAGNVVDFHCELGRVRVAVLLAQPGVPEPPEKRVPIRYP
jgi:hypothetical protein